ncbi:MAG TPA: hypothetical protein VF703_08675 [Pyrinomonadaceae bacterium]|jgi:hypothetical protein
MRYAPRGLSIISAAVATLILISPNARRSEVQAQGARESRRLEMETRQRDLWNLERANRRPPDRARDARPAYQQVKEDFEQLQLSSYNLSGAAGAAAPTLDYTRIQAESAEIRKRAARLMTTLRLPEPEKEQKQKKGGREFATADLLPVIAALEGLVKSFVWNPVFQQSGVVDVQNSARARRDLEDIIKLSEQIRKAAEAAGKGGGRN